MTPFKLRWFPFVPPSQSPALCHPHLQCPFQSHFPSDGPCGSLSHAHPSRAQHAPSLGLQGCWGGCHACKGAPGRSKPSAFLSFLQGQSYKPLVRAAMVWHIWSGNITSSHLEAEAQAGDSRGQRWRETHMREGAGKNKQGGKHTPTQCTVWAFTRARQSSERDDSLPSSSFHSGQIY